MPVLPRAASAGQKGSPLLTVLMPLAQLVKSTACMPSTLIKRTRLIWWWKSLFWANAVPMEQSAARESKASVFFIGFVLASRGHSTEHGVTGMLKRIELFVKTVEGNCGKI